MRATTSTLFALLAAATVAAAMDARSPDGSWTMTVPEGWEAAKGEAYEKAPRGVHAMFASPPDDTKTRALLQVSVIEKPLFVSNEGRGLFLKESTDEVKNDEAAKAGVQIDIEKVELEHIGDRDVYRMEASQVVKDMTVKLVKWYVPAGDRQYVFSFSTAAKTYPYRVVEFEQVAKSIRMRDAAPAKPGPGTDWSLVVTVSGLAVAVICGIAFVVVLRTQFRRAPEAVK